MKHVLVTNDFPPKVGGIQSYLWELWRRLDPADVVVLTAAHPDAADWDRRQEFRIDRTCTPVLLPTPALRRRVRELAREVGAEFVVIDPVLPLGALGPSLGMSYGVVAHGAEITMPGRLPLSRGMMSRVLRGAELVIAAGGYPLAEAERAAGRSLPHVIVPPGVDTGRFVPLTPDDAVAARRRLGLPLDGALVVCVSRLVPRKGFDRVIDAAARLRGARPDLTVAIGGAGRDRRRLERRAAASGAPVVFLGRVDNDDLPALFGCADAFAMICRNRWGGLEAEGFGIVFLEAAACGVPQVAGRSGGSHEAVNDGITGLVVDHPRDVVEVAGALATVLDDEPRREAMAAASRRWAARFDYDDLAGTLAQAIETTGDRVARSRPGTVDSVAT